VKIRDYEMIPQKQMLGKLSNFEVSPPSLQMFKKEAVRGNPSIRCPNDGND